MRLDVPLFPEQASTLAAKVDHLYFFALTLSAFFSLLIAVFIFVFFVKYRRRRAGEVGEPAHGSMALEVIWSVVPLLITMVLFGWGARVFLEQMTPPEGGVEYFATAKQWMWKFQHPTGQREINALHVPVGETIKLTMTSEDVIHSFYVPAFRVKQDVVPGRYTQIWFQATKPGTYHLFCAEYCGAEHSQMIGWVTVMEPADYETWLSGGAKKSLASAGEDLFQQLGCITCHRADSGGRGPALTGVFGKTVSLQGGAAAMADEGYLRESILDPQAKVVSGYQPIMPTFKGLVSEEQVLALITYIKTLGAAAAGEGSAPGVAATTAGREP